MLISSGLSGVRPFGIRSCGSASVMRCINSLAPTSPGTIGCFPDLAGFKASSRKSRLNFACCRTPPWHVTQFLFRIGRTSRLKSTAVCDSATCAPPQKSRRASNPAPARSPLRCIARPRRVSPASIKVPSRQATRQSRSLPAWRRRLECDLRRRQRAAEADRQLRQDPLEARRAFGCHLSPPQIERPEAGEAVERV